MIQLHPGAADAYRRLAEDLHLDRDEVHAVDQFAQFPPHLFAVLALDRKGLGKFQLEVHGSLAALPALGQAQKAENPTGGACGVSLGAGAGFEPATFRL